MYLPRGSIMSFSDISTPAVKKALSEHNRQPLQVSPERIEHKQRMANGRLRSWWISDKKKWTLSWTNLPHDTAKTVDGHMGAEDLEQFYYSHPGEFIVHIRLPNGTESSHFVMFSSFSKTVSKRGVYEMWNVDLELEEV